MSSFDLGVLAMTVFIAAVGGVSIHWARADAGSRRARGGRVLFVLTLLGIGAIASAAAFARAQGLPPLGIVAGLLIVGMTWESPTPRRVPRAEPLSPDGQAS